MTCCGKKRQAVGNNPGGDFFKATQRRANSVGDAKTAKRKFVVFEYTGRSAMAVRGPFSGIVYRFERPGVALKTDPADYAVLLTVPGLRVKKKTHDG
jgi:hypothetical protein